MEKLFGTDGIRGKANTYPITANVLLNLAKAAAMFFLGSSVNKKVMIAKDTRASGDMIEACLCAGFSSMGFDVEKTGVIPTPALSYITANSDVDFSVMISASHNPYYDNGIKFFKGNGKKLLDGEQDKITEIYYDKTYEEYGVEPGRIFENHGSSILLYEKLFEPFFNEKKPLEGKKIVLDTANGACFEIAPEIFEKLGAEVFVCFDSPDGYNINENCGSEHIEKLSEIVLSKKADFGLAFDGDGDRLIAVDDNGEKLTGDQIIAVNCDILEGMGKKPEKIVTTIMSNLGLRKYLEDRNIEHIQTKVGDRYVYEAMLDNNTMIGGEDSGHLIFREYQNTGDGILSGVILSVLAAKSGKKLSKLVKVIKIYPQKLVNIDVKSKPPVDEIKELSEVIKEAEKRLDKKGRVLVRYSGTQNYMRVMCEAESYEMAEEICKLIGDCAVKVLG